MSFLLLGLAAGVAIGFWLAFPNDADLRKAKALERKYAILKKLKDEFGIKNEDN